MSTRGRKKLGKLNMKKKRFKAVHQKVKLFRANEPLLTVFMWGINHRMSELDHVPPPVMLLPDDFKAFAKIKVDNHNFNKESMPSHYKVKEYCPHVFRNLRERFGVDNHTYIRSLSKKQPVEVESPGRSGARFFQSYDMKFVIKTMSPEEVAELHQILKHYHEYVVERNGRTLIPQYLGAYRLTVEGAETYLCVMRNVMGRRYAIHKKYDLKGSTVERNASDKEKAKEMPTFKDNDFIDDSVQLFLPEEVQDKVREMLTSDTEFLAKLRLMDYSLLVGIHDMERAEREQEEEEARTTEGTSATPLQACDSSEPGEQYTEDSDSDQYSHQPTPPDSPVASTGAFAWTPTGNDSQLDLTDEFYAIPSRPGAPKRELYFLGLVDILTYYGMKKRTALAAKTVKYGSDAENISTVEPRQYSRRLVDFITQRVLAP